MSSKSGNLLDFDNDPLDDFLSSAASSSSKSSKPANNSDDTPFMVKCVNCDRMLPLSEIEAHSKTCSSSASSKSNAKTGSEPAKAADAKTESGPRQVADEASSLGLNLATPSKMSTNILSDVAGAITSFVTSNKGEPEADMPDISLNNPILQRDYTRTTRIAFVVDEPKEGGGRFSGFVSYRVNWRTEMKSYGGAKCYYVRRKFTDFEFFHRHLTRLFPHCIIPPLASPQGFMQKEFDVPFRERRMRLLQRYLNRIGNHPILAESGLLALFLMKGKKDDWEKVMKDMDEEDKREKAGPGRNSKPYGGEAPTMSPADEEANKAAKEMRNELQLLIAGFRELHKQLEIHVTSKTTFQQQTVLVTQQILKFSQMDQLRRPVANIDTSPMVNALSAFTATFSAIDEVNLGSITIESETMWEVIRDWTYYLRAADEYLTRFFTLRANCAFSLSAYQARVKAIAPASPAGGNSNAVTTTDDVVDAYLSQLEETKNFDQSKYEAVLKTFEKETVRWEVYKQREIIHWTNYYAKQQIQSHQAAISAWENFVNKNALRANK